MAYCPTCGNEISHDARFCANCGQEFVPQAAETARATTAARYEPPASGQQPGWQQRPGTWPGQKVGLPHDGPDSLADPGQRLLARIIDVGITVVVWVALSISLAVLGTAFDTAGAGDVAGLLFAIILPMFIVAVFTYELVMIAIWGQTLGKMAMGIRVVRSASGNIPGWGPAFIRWIVPAAMLIIPFLPFLNLLWLLWDENRQCLHDKAASTFVVRLR